MFDNGMLIFNITSLSVKQAMDLAENKLREKNIQIFARINHSQAANAVGLSMQEEELLIFGDPKVGTALMLEKPEIGIELPLKLLAWQAPQHTMLAHHDFERLASLFNIQMTKDTIHKIKTFMDNLVASLIV